MQEKLPVLLIVGAIVGAALQFLPLPGTAVTYERVEAGENVAVTQPAESATTSLIPPADTRSIVQHTPLPDAVRAIYMSACVAGTPNFRQQLVDLINETEVNSVMIDIKDFSGTIAFPVASTSDWYAAWQNADCGARDMQDFIATLHEQDIFVIGRITVFQDPFYAPRHPQQAVQTRAGNVWRDHKGLSFVDVAATEYWQQVVDLAALSYNLGFDELNFDYVRYPSDGNMEDTYFPQSVAGEHGDDKQANLEAFFAYLHAEMNNPENFAAVRHANTGRSTSTPWTSADLFGITTSYYEDHGIGQVQERAAPYFDFIAPMVYPSHYTNSFLGGRNPNSYPYEVVYEAMSDGVARMIASTTPQPGFLHEPIMATNASGTAQFSGHYTKPVFGPDKFRTWIQDFDYGGDYDTADVRAQFQASYDAGVDSWMIWAPSNRYTRGALQPASESDS